MTFLKISPILSYRRAVKIANRKVRLLVQIERKRVSSKAAASRYLWSEKFRTSVGFIDFETGRKDRRSGPGDFSSWLQRGRAHNRARVHVASLTD